MRQIRNLVRGQLLRGFKSLPFRSFSALLNCCPPSRLAYQSQGEMAMVPKKLITMLIFMPLSWYFLYGPPLKKIMRNRYLDSLKKQCGTQPDHDTRARCLHLGQVVLDSCERFIHIASFKTRLPECINEQQLKLKICLKTHEPEVCAVRLVKR
jgi:hypothetical protein